MAACQWGSFRAARAEVGMGEMGCGVEAERAYRGFCLDMPARARVIIGWPMTGAGAIDGDELPDEG